MIDPRVSSNTGREAIYAAVFARLSVITGLGCSSRIWRAPDELNDGQFPALFCEEQPEEKITEQDGRRWKWILKVDVTVYVAANQSDVPVGQETAVPATTLNELIDQVEAAFAVPLGQRQTLGGLVQHAEIKGRILRAAGIPAKSNQVSMAVIPVVITTL